jgi:hypothetical protein
MIQPQPNPKPPRPESRSPSNKPPPPPIVRYEKVMAACGHEVDFGLFEDKKDKYRAARRQKKMGQLCPACREQKEQEVQEAARQRRQEKAKAKEQQPQPTPRKPKQLPQRLPDGARFNVVYDAAKQEWSGTLTIGSDVFSDSASGVFALLTRLDRLYRNQVQPIAQEESTTSVDPEEG